ncbi:hypothetical protein KKB40_04020 [Patescibacteria group bacterium]|nr:hypothetical protein [Patescibacteria group bacterium]
MAEDYQNLKMGPRERLGLPDTEFLVGQKFLVCSPSGELGEPDVLDVKRSRLKSFAQVEIVGILGVSTGRIYDATITWKDADKVGVSRALPDRVAVKVCYGRQAGYGESSYTLAGKTWEKAEKLGEEIAIPKVFGVLDLRDMERDNFAYAMENVPPTDVLQFKKEFSGGVVPLLAILDIADSSLVTNVVLAEAGYYQADRKPNQDYRFGRFPDRPSYRILDWDVQIKLNEGEAISQHHMERELVMAGSLVVGLVQSKDSRRGSALGVSYLDFSRLKEEEPGKVLDLLMEITDILPESMADLVKTMIASPTKVNWEKALLTVRDVRCEIEDVADNYSTMGLSELENMEAQTRELLDLYWKSDRLGKNYSNSAKTRKERFLQAVKQKEDVPSKIIEQIKEDGVKSLYWRQAVIDAAIRKKTRDKLGERGIVLPSPEEQRKKAKSYL